MIFLLQLLAWLVAMVAGAWVFRFIGQRIEWANFRVPAWNEYFRDMNLMVAFGFVFAFVALFWSVVLYFFWGVTFFRWAVNGLLFFAVCGFIFRWLGRTIGTPLSKKIFRDMPITAAFGVLTILVYAILAVFADFIAPYGQAEVSRLNQRPARQ